MKKILNANKFLVVFLLIICVIFILNPMKYSKVCLEAVTVWSTKVFPMLFPFFILTKSIVALSVDKQSCLDKYFNKFYHTPPNSLKTFCLSALCGYPMGAKLICDMYDNNQIDKENAKHLFSFCSISGPIFMIGSVGVAILGSFKAGLIILIANLLSSLINGLIYRPKTLNLKNENKNIKKQDTSISSIMYDSLISILMVGGYIIIAFLIIEICMSLNIFNCLSSILSSLLFKGKFSAEISAIFSGIIEITKGAIDVNACQISLQIKTIICSTLIGFGGISVLMQSLSFLSKVKLPVKTMVKQKISQAILCLIFSFILSVLFIK